MPQEAEPAAGRLPLLIFVGGFLGSGKTTLILKAARILRDRGQRAAVIMNDQDEGLVDTQQSVAQGLPTREVTGGCFCCRYSDLLEAAGQLAAYRPHVIFAEPVGSCIDLSATLLQPLRAFRQSDYRLAPLTVLLDPLLATGLHTGDLHPDVEFLLGNQIAEADLLCVSKQDAVTDLPPVTFPIDFHLSARTGAGVEEWLDEVLASTRVVGARLLEVDYGRYAAAEASLGWLNLHADLQLTSACSPALLAGPLLDRLDLELTARGIQIVHLKLFDRTSSGWIKASISSNGGEPQAEGDLLAEPSLDHQLAINLRALTGPDLLRDIVGGIVKELPGRVRIRHLAAFRPPAPVPEHRFAERP